MAALHATPTAPAATDPHPEPGHLRGWDTKFGLILIGVADRVEFTAATRARVGQQCGKGAIRVGWDLTMVVAAMRLAFPTARPFRVLDRVALGERCRLAFPGPPGLAQQFLQLGDPQVAFRERGAGGLRGGA